MPVLKRFGPFPFKKTGRRGTGAVTLNNFAAAPIGPYENWGREREGLWARGLSGTVPSPFPNVLLLSNQPGGNKGLKQHDARRGGEVDAADFARDGDADTVRRELDDFGREP